MRLVTHQNQALCWQAVLLLEVYHHQRASLEPCV